MQCTGLRRPLRPGAAAAAALAVGTARVLALSGPFTTETNWQDPSQSRSRSGSPGCRTCRLSKPDVQVRTVTIFIAIKYNIVQYWSISNQYNSNKMTYCTEIMDNIVQCFVLYCYFVQSQSYIQAMRTIGTIIFFIVRISKDCYSLLEYCTK